jgi:tartrate-resistant acid phosphatase type 5
MLSLGAFSMGATKFITLGDWGGFALGSYHATTVTAVAKQMAATARAASIPFVVNTGDNFYYCGIQNTSDPQIQQDFTGQYGQYSSLNVPWYGVLGNHEYGYSVEAQIELAKTSTTPPWVMDDRYYTKRVAIGGGNHISFIFIDTNPCVSAYRADDPSGWDPCGTEFPTCSPIEEGPCHFHENILSQDCSTQFTWFKSALAAVPKSDWLIVVGHHPADEIDVEDVRVA